MNGYADDNRFGPDDTLTRGEAACVLCNIAEAAGLDVTAGTVGASFTDIDSDAYYATAVAWAERADVIHGYGDGMFRPDQPVTREEFAAMLANYASEVGGFADDDESLLAGYPDGSGVSGWARPSVAWAVANRVMGNGPTLNPTGSITRAETAAMVVNFHGAKA